MRGLCSSLYSLPAPICKMIASSSVKPISCPRIWRNKDVLPPLHPNVIFCPGLAAAQFRHFAAHDGEDATGCSGSDGLSNFVQPLKNVRFKVTDVSTLSRRLQP